MALPSCFPRSSRGTKTIPSRARFGVRPETHAMAPNGAVGPCRSGQRNRKAARSGSRSRVRSAASLVTWCAPLGGVDDELAQTSCVAALGYGAQGGEGAPRIPTHLVAQVGPAGQEERQGLRVDSR